MRSIAYDKARLKKVAALVQGSRVLDIGYAQNPNPYIQNCHRIGYDINLPVEGAVRYEEEVRGDVRDIVKAFQDQSFDTIICAELIEHLECPYDFLRNLLTLLRPGGRLIVTTPNPLGFPVFFCELLNLRRFFYTKEHLYYFLPRWVVRMLEHTGYDVAFVKPIGWWLPFGVLGLCPTALSYQVIYVAQKPAQKSKF